MAEVAHAFIIYELIGVLIFLIALIVKKKFNFYIVLFVLLFFLFTYFVVPFINVRWMTHRYLVRIGATILAGAIAYGVYLLDMKFRK